MTLGKHGLSIGIVTGISVLSLSLPEVPEGHMALCLNLPSVYERLLQTAHTMVHSFSPLPATRGLVHDPSVHAQAVGYDTAGHQ